MCKGKERIQGLFNHRVINHWHCLVRVVMDSPLLGRVCFSERFFPVQRGMNEKRSFGLCFAKIRLDDYNGLV